MKKFTPEKQPKGKLAQKYLIIQIVAINLFAIVLLYAMWHYYQTSF